MTSPTSDYRYTEFEYSLYVAKTLQLGVVAILGETERNHIMAGALVSIGCEVA